MKIKIHLIYSKFKPFISLNSPWINNEWQNPNTTSTGNIFSSLFHVFCLFINFITRNLAALLIMRLFMLQKKFLLPPAESWNASLVSLKLARFFFWYLTPQTSNMLVCLRSGTYWATARWKLFPFHPCACFSSQKKWWSCFAFSARF